MDRRNDLRVLLLDDNAALVDLYKRRLEAAGPFQVTVETDSRRARRRAETQLFDCVVIDAKLAYRGVEFGGLRLADDLRPRYGANSIIVISRFITAELLRERELDLIFIEKHDDADGHRFVAELAERIVAACDQQYAFIAMPFDDRLRALYDKSLRPAVQEAGFRSVRVDDIAHTRNISTVILELVEGSKFVVFVGDEANPNAYYEAGFADAMRKEVIIAARALSDLTFDVSGRHTLTYKSLSGLRAGLSTQIHSLRTQIPPGY